MNQFILKITLLAVAAGMIIPVLPVKKVEAQFGIPTVIEFGPIATGLITTISTSTASTALSTGAIGQGTATIVGIRSSLGAACTGTLATLDTASTISSVGDVASNSVISVIGGGTFEMTKVSAKLASATAAKACVDLYVEALSNAPTLTLQTSNEFAREQDKFTKVSAALRQQIQDLNAQQSASIKDIVKAFMIKVVLNVSKNLTTEMVNKMVEKYKISDYLAYSDAVATQIYSMKYINENFAGDARQQMMIRSLLQSEKFPEKIKTVQSFANSKAQEYLGTACNAANPTVAQNDQNYFLKCLAAYGAPESSAQYHYLTAIDQTNTAKAAANASTQAELNQSSGFAPPRNCAGSLSMQQQIDTQYDTVYLEKDIAVATAARLKTALAAGKTTQAEYDKAQAAADQATANANALGTRSDSPIIDICEAIDSPAQFVSSSINSYLAKHFDESSQLKSENLPFYANFLADVASNFLTNILTGGKSTSQVLKEAGVGALNGALIGVSQQAQGNQIPTTTTPTNPTGDVEVYALVNGSRTTTLAPNSSYELVIDFSDLVASSSNNNDPVFNPYRLLISGATSGSDTNITLSAAEISAGRIILDGTTPANNQSFTIRVQAYARAVQGTTGDVPLNTSGGWQQRFTVAQVAGTATVLPRGPMASVR